MEINRIAVIGTGLMGIGIVHVGALAGYEMHMVDVNQQVLDKAFETIKSDMLKSVERTRLASDTMEDALTKIHKFINLEDSVKNVDLVIEAVPENMDLKKEIFSKLDILTNRGTILATNTSTMSPTEIASSTNRPDKVIAMHFFNPVHKMKLLEIIRGLDTSEETVNIALEVGRRMNKETVVVNEFPGFIPSRISALVGNEAFYMLQEGVASAQDIDKAIKLGLNYPMGPFELGDLVGLDTRLKNLEYLNKTLGEKYRPCPLLVKYVKAGRLGRKSGKGVYEYE